MVSFEEIMEKLRDAGSDGTSELKLRNENAQTKSFVKRLSFLKKEAKQKTKLLIPTELAIPFNPRTGVADEQYNPDNKFRPVMSATKLALALKSLANESEETKQAFMGRAGVDEWDTSDLDNLTEDDKKIFKKYRVPSVFSLPVVHVDIPTITGDRGRDYVVDFEKNDFGEIVDQDCMLVQANRFFTSMNHEKVQEYKEKIAKGEIKDTPENQKKTISTMYNNNPVSDEMAANYVIAIASQINNDFDLVEEYNQISVKELEQKLVIAKRTKGLKDFLDKYLSGEFNKWDTHWDYFEVDMCCPDTLQEQQDYQAITFEKPVEPIKKYAWIDSFDEVVCEYLDNRKDLEKVVLATLRLPKYDEKVERQLTSALHTVIDVKSPYLTKECCKNFAGFLTLTLGSDADDLLADLELGLSDRPDGKANPAALQEDYNLSKLMLEEDAEETELEEVDLLQGTVE